MLSNLSQYSLLLIYPLIAAILSLVITKVCVMLLPRLGYLDIPRGRHAHKAPTPRGGGIAIILSFFICFPLYLLNSSPDSSVLIQDKTKFAGFCIAASLIVLLGLIDDRFELPSWIKLAVQIVAAGVLSFSGDGFCSLLGYELPSWANFILTELWCIGIINAFNLIDGLDGLAAGLAAVSS